MERFGSGVALPLVLVVAIFALTSVALVDGGPSPQPAAVDTHRPAVEVIAVPSGTAVR